MSPPIAFIWDGPKSCRTYSILIGLGGDQGFLTDNVILQDNMVLVQFAKEGRVTIVLLPIPCLNGQGYPLRFCSIYFSPWMDMSFIELVLTFVFE